MAPKPRLTHFLCLPLVNASSKESLLAALERFRSVAMADIPEDQRETISRSIRPIGSLHLTLGVMSLVDQERVDAAVKYFGDFDFHSLLSMTASSSSLENESTEPSALSRPPGLEVSLKHLFAMKDPTSTSILCASPYDVTNRLQPFCEALRSKFQAQGFIVEENRPLRLHATILNTVYATGRGRARWRRARSNRDRPLIFDASNLIEAYQDTVLAANVKLDKIAICRMGTKKILSSKGEVIDEAYEEIVSREL